MVKIFLNAIDRKHLFDKFFFAYDIGPSSYSTDIAGLSKRTKELMGKVSTYPAKRAGKILTFWLPTG